MNVPLFGLGVGTKSVSVSGQLRTNLYCEPLSEADKSPMALYARPGLVRSTTLPWHPSSGSAAWLVSGPVRGSIQAFTAGMPLAIDNVVVAAGNAAYLTQTISSKRGLLEIGQLQTKSGAVGIAYNGTDVIIVDGAAGYCYNVATATGGVIANANFPNGTASVCFLASRYFLPDPTVPGRFRWSALLDGTTYAALDFATAEFDPDPLTCAFSARGELLLFGSSTLEYWSPVTSAAVVQRIGGTTQQWGCTAAGSIKKVSGTVAFIGRPQGGDRCVAILNGYTPIPISTPDIDREIANEVSPDSITADAHEFGGHTVYVMHLASRSWAYDLENKSWSIWSTDAGRFGAQYNVTYRGQLQFFDYRDRRIYNLSPTTYTDDGAVMVREVTSRHQFNEAERMTCWELQVDMETGQGIGSGQGSNPQVMLQVSKDGGHTFGSELWATMGAMGNYLTRAIWRRMGMARDWVFRLRITDPVKVVIIQAFGRFE